MNRLLRQPITNLRRLAIWLIAGNLLVAVALSVATWSNLRDSRAGDEAMALQTTENMAHGLSIELNAELRLIDNALATMVLHHRRSVGSAEHADVMAQALVDQRSLLQHVAGLRIADREGQVAAGLSRDERVISNVADRRYFQEASRTDAMVVSEPLVSRVNGQWSLIVARRLTDGLGRFDGVVYAIVMADHFIARFSALNLGRSGAISLRTEDLRLVARYSAAEPTSTKGFGATNVSDEMRRRLATNPEAGWYITPTALDKVERITAYRRVAGYPLIIATGMATDEFLAQWRQHAAQQVCLIALVMLVIAGMSTYLYFKHRREFRARLEASRLAREQSLMLENDMIGMLRVRDRTALWGNRALASILGYEPGELSGKPSRALYLDDASFAHVGAAGYAALRNGERFRTQLQMRRKDGSPIWIDLSGTAVSESESLWMMVDIEALKQREEHAYGLAFRDPLTGLPNRRLFEEKFNDILANAQRSGRGVSLCYLDLDGFKPVNDVHGHDAGDTVLRAVGARLQTTLRGNDLVARLGGDEFAVVLTDLADASDVLPVLERCLAQIELPVSLASGPQVTVSASLGALMGKGTASALDLMRAADAAMYAAKRAGKGRIHFDHGATRPAWRAEADTPLPRQQPEMA